MPIILYIMGMLIVIKIIINFITEGGDYVRSQG